MPKKQPEWLRQYNSISPSQRRKLGITKANFKKEYIAELRTVRKARRQ